MIYAQTEHIEHHNTPTHHVLYVPTGRPTAAAVIIFFIPCAIFNTHIYIHHCGSTQGTSRDGHAHIIVLIVVVADTQTDKTRHGTGLNKRHVPAT